MPKKMKEKKKISDFNGFDFDLIALFDDGASFFFLFPFSWVIRFCFVRVCVRERMFLCPQMMLKTKWIGAQTRKKATATTKIGIHLKVEWPNELKRASGALL